MLHAHKMTNYFPCFRHQIVFYVCPTIHTFVSVTSTAYICRQHPQFIGHHICTFTSDTWPFHWMLQRFVQHTQVTLLGSEHWHWDLCIYTVLGFNTTGVLSTEVKDLYLLIWLRENCSSIYCPMWQNIFVTAVLWASRSDAYEAFHAETAAMT